MSTSPDHGKLYQIAERQAGYFTARQARSAGFGPALLSYYAKTGRLQRVRRGLYRLVEFPEMPLADLFIAWLSVGEEAVVSHDSALALYDLSDLIPSEIHLTVPRTTSRRRKGVRLHTRRLSPDEVTRREGLPVTTVLRTLADVILDGLSDALVRQAIQEALARGLVTRDALLKDALRRGGRVARLVQSSLRWMEGHEVQG
jgi:predicted transcriptional regulator of viral defense system